MHAVLTADLDNYNFNFGLMMGKLKAIRESLAEVMGTPLANEKDFNESLERKGYTVVEAAEYDNLLNDASNSSYHDWKEYYDELEEKKNKEN